MTPVIRRPVRRCTWRRSRRSWYTWATVALLLEWTRRNRPLPLLHGREVRGLARRCVRHPLTGSGIRTARSILFRRASALGSAQRRIAESAALVRTQGLRRRYVSGGLDSVRSLAHKRRLSRNFTSTFAV